MLNLAKLPGLSRRAAHTLLYITEVKTFRIDTDKNGLILGEAEVIEVDCPTSNTLPVALAQMLEQTEKFGRRLWILYVRLNSFQLSLPAVQVEGVEDEVLEQALQFEYEALTDNSLSNNVLSYQLINSIDEMNNYWVNAIARETFDDLLALCKDAALKFGGLTHPGGFPGLLSSSDESSWLRLECWPGKAFAISKSPEQGFNLQIFPTETQGDWQREIDQWILETGSVDKSEALMNNQLEYLPATDENYRLTLDGALIFWMGQWAQLLVADDEATPIPLLAESGGLNKELVYRVGGGAAALLLCLSHALLLQYQTSDYQYQFEELSQADKELSAYRDSLQKNKTLLQDLTRQVKSIDGNIDVIPVAMNALKQRPAVLLKMLAEGSPEDLLAESINMQGNQVVVTGVSLKANLSNQLAQHLETALAELGWKVHPPTKTAMGLFDNGGPWSFAMQIEDLGLKGFIENKG